MSVVVTIVARSVTLASTPSLGEIDRYKLAVLVNMEPSRKMLPPLLGHRKGVPVNSFIISSFSSRLQSGELSIKVVHKIVVTFMVSLDPSSSVTSYTYTASKLFGLFRSRASTFA